MLARRATSVVPMVVIRARATNMVAFSRHIVIMCLSAQAAIGINFPHPHMRLRFIPIQVRTSINNDNANRLAPNTHAFRIIEWQWPLDYAEPQ